MQLTVLSYFASFQLVKWRYTPLNHLTRTNWLMQMPISKWCMARLVVKNKHQKKNKCYDEIRLCAQNDDNCLGSIINTIENVYMIVWRDLKLVVLIKLRILPKAHATWETLSTLDLVETCWNFRLYSQDHACNNLQVENCMYLKINFVVTSVFMLVIYTRTNLLLNKVGPTCLNSRQDCIMLVPLFFSYTNLGLYL